MTFRSRVMGALLLALCSGCSDDDDPAAPKADASSDAAGDASASDATSEAASDAAHDSSNDAGADASEPTPMQPVIVAVGYGGRRLRSLDLGLSWIDLIEDDPDGGDDQNLLRATSFANGLFVAVGWRIWSSPDGASWSEHSVSGAQWCGGVAYGNGTFLCAGGCGQSLVSTDGTTWQEASDALDGCSHLRSLAFGNGIFVAFGDSGIAVTSNDGSSWTDPQNVGGSGVIFRNGEFVANGDDMHYTSTNGTDWTQHAGTTNTEAFGHGVYLRGQWKGRIERSTDGTSWTTVFDDGGNHLTSFSFGEIPLGDG